MKHFERRIKMTGNYRGSLELVSRKLEKKQTQLNFKGNYCKILPWKKRKNLHTAFTRRKWDCGFTESHNQCWHGKGRERHCVCKSLNKKIPNDWHTKNFHDQPRCWEELKGMGTHCPFVTMHAVNEITLLTGHPK